MSVISMDLIKILREKTDVGIAECKKALEEAGGDIDTAVEILRKKGIAKAAKREGREATEGIIKAVANEAGNEGYIVEINAETDFVVRNEKFQDFSDRVLAIVQANKPSTIENLMNIKMNSGTVKDNLDSLSGVIGEKLGIKRCDVLSGGTVAAYSHGGGKIGVLVALDKAGQAELAREIAMQIAAANPRYIKPQDVPAEEISKEKEIYAEQLRKKGKPENIIEKVIKGKLNRYFAEVCLLEQEYIKDETKRVKDILGEVKVEEFIRYSL